MKEMLAIHGGSPVSERMIFFGEPLFDEKEEKYLLETLRSGWIGFGPKCQLFENKFEEYISSKWALSVSSCSAAIHTALLVNGLNENDEVISTPLTFIATINAILQTGAKPVLVDIDPITLNIDIKKVESAITSKTKAILPVHFGGLPVDIDAIEDIACRNNIAIIYDAAHALLL